MSTPRRCSVRQILKTKNYYYTINLSNKGQYDKMIIRVWAAHSSEVCNSADSPFFSWLVTTRYFGSRYSLLLVLRSRCNPTLCGNVGVIDPRSFTGMLKSRFEAGLGLEMSQDQFIMTSVSVSVLVSLFLVSVFRSILRWVRILCVSSAFQPHRHALKESSFTLVWYPTQVWWRRHSYERRLKASMPA